MASLSLSTERDAMVYVHVHCPDCQGIDVVRYGTQRNGVQRYRCNNTACPRHIFLLQYQNQGRLPAVKQRIVDMALNGSGIRDTARVLGVSPTTVIETIKKKNRSSSKPMKDCSRRLILRRLRSSSTRWRKPRSMRCGALWAAKVSSGGYGMPLSTIQDRS